MTKKKDLTGLENSEAIGTNAKDTGYDLTKALLAAAEFRTSEEAIKEIDICRNGVHYFTFHVHPISDKEARAARKAATKFMPNPNNRKLPPIEKEFDSAKFHSLLIYSATTAEDQEKIWNNPQVKDKYDILEPAEMVDLLLSVGEKLEIVDLIMDISGMEENDATPEEYAKN